MLAIRERLLPAGHWLIAEARSGRGASLCQPGREPEAEALLHEGYHALAARRPAGDPVVRRALGAPVEQCRRVGRRDAAIRYSVLLPALALPSGAHTAVVGRR